MGIYIKNWSLADWKELLKWAKIGANNAMIGEFAEVEEIQQHGRLIDADALRYWSDDSAMIAFDYVTRSQINAAPTIIPAEMAEESE